MGFTLPVMEKKGKLIPAAVLAVAAVLVFVFKDKLFGEDSES